MKLTKEWNGLFQAEILNIKRAYEILAIWELQGKDTEDQRECLESSI